MYEEVAERVDKCSDSVENDKKKEDLHSKCKTDTVLW